MSNKRSATRIRIEQRIWKNSRERWATVLDLSSKDIPLVADLISGDPGLAPEYRDMVISGTVRVMVYRPGVTPNE